MATETYAKQVNDKLVLRLRSIIADLPPYVKTFFIGIADKAIRTRVAYAYDIHTFFEFLHETNPSMSEKPLMKISLADLDQLTAMDIEEYLDYLTLYHKPSDSDNPDSQPVKLTNNERAKKRKLCALRVFFNYLYIHDMLSQNVTVKVNMPKIHDKAIIRMEANEVADFLDNVEYGSQMSDHQKRFHDRTKVRDLALLTLMLSTGIRVSECVGLDITDVDFDNCRIKVVRKGGYEAFVYFSDEAEAALQEYLKQRKKNKNVVKGHENALFLSNRNTRISVRSVEVLVKKYARVTTPLKHITPHKLRSTYGTELYQETGDIYLVADVLGHKDVNTTKKHYAEMNDYQRRNARNIVQLRDPDKIVASIKPEEPSDQADSEDDIE